MKVVFGGHWDQLPDGWLNMPEAKQDITKRLSFEDDSVNVIFNEHVLEHLHFEGAIHFFKESFRVLKKGGILRIACPCIDKMIQFKNDEIGRHYSDIQTKHYYPTEDSILKELGLEGIREEPIAFMMDSLFKGHNHRFIWTSYLIQKVLLKIRFSEVHILQPGESNFDKENCMERTIRGVDPNYVLHVFGKTKYDPETMVVEAKK